MANYLEKYNYQPVNAFQTDYAGILKGLEVKEAYWKQGVQRVKSAYEQAAGLSLTGEPAKNKLKNFMEAADGQLKKALATDVSMYDNAASAISIYSPLYKDKDLMDNHSVTDFYQKEFSTINSLRTKDGGKYYSDINARDVMNSYQDFEKGVNQGVSSTEFVNKKRSYTPYHDVSKESFEILSKCKPNKTSVEGAGEDPLLLKTVTDESLTSSKLAGCLSQLSDLSKNQILITNRVKFHDNPTGLGNAWLDLGQKDLNLMTEQLKAVNLKASENKGRPEDYKYYSDLSKTLEDRIKNKQQRLGNLAKGDYSDVTNNFDEYALEYGLHSHVSEFGQAFSQEDTTTEYTGNPAALQRDRQNFEIGQGDTDFQRDIYKIDKEQEDRIELEFFKQFGRKMSPADKGKLLRGETIGGFENPYLPPQDDQTSNDNGEAMINKLNEEIASADSSIKEAGNTLQAQLGSSSRDETFFKDFGISSGKSFNPNIAKDFDGQIKLIEGVIGTNSKVEKDIQEQNLKITRDNKKNGTNNPLLPVKGPYLNSTISALKDYVTKVKTLQNKKNINLKIQEINEEKINERFAKDNIDLQKDVATIAPITIIGNGQSLTITSQDMLNFIKDGRSGNFTIIKDALEKKIPFISYNGVPIKMDPVSSGKLFALSYQVSKKTNKLTDDIKKYKNQIYGIAYAQTENIFTDVFTRDDKLKKAAVEEASSKLGIDPKEFEKLGYSVGYTKNGEVAIIAAKGTELKLRANGTREIKNTEYSISAYKSDLSLPISTVPSEISDNESLQILEQTFRTNGKPNRWIELKNESIPRKDNKSTPIKIEAFKDTAGTVYYHIKTDNNNDGNWDIPRDANAIYDWREAVLMYERLKEVIKAQ